MGCTLLSKIVSFTSFSIQGYIRKVGANSVSASDTHLRFFIRLLVIWSPCPGAFSAPHTQRHGDNQLPKPLLYSRVLSVCGLVAQVLSCSPVAHAHLLATYRSYACLATVKISVRSCTDSLVCLSSPNSRGGRNFAMRDQSSDCLPPRHERAHARSSAPILVSRAERVSLFCQNVSLAAAVCFADTISI